MYADNDKQGLSDKETPPASIDPLLALYSTPGHLIRRAKQKATLTFAPVTRHFKVTPQQYSVMKVVDARPAVDQAELGELVGLDTSTTGQIVLRLEQRGLLSRRPDGRRQRVEITPEGKAILEKLKPFLKEIQAEITDSLTAKETDQLLRLLSKMLGISNLHYQPKQKRQRRLLDLP